MDQSLDDALLKGEKHFQLLGDFVPQLMWLANPDGWIYWYNKKCYDYSGATAEQIEGWGWRDVIEPNALPALMEGWTKAIATGEPFEMVFPIRGADGSFRPFLSRAQPVKDAEGKVLRWVGTNTDISEQKQAENRLELLLGELNHRVKNTLATVQAISNLSFHTLPRKHTQAFQERLLALSRAHDLLMRSNWEAAELYEIVSQTLAPLCAGQDGRRAVKGPAVLIPANSAAVWSMVVHELGTNALKHGALRTGRARSRLNGMRWKKAGCTSGGASRAALQSKLRSAAASDPVSSRALGVSSPAAQASNSSLTALFARSRHRFIHPKAVNWR